MGDFRVFPAPGQAHFLHQRHLRHWAENFQKCGMKKKFLEKLLSFPEIYFGHAGTTQSLRNRFFRKKKSENVANSRRPPTPFSYLRDISSKIRFNLQKSTFLAIMLFLLRFGCCFCCFSKSREPGDVATYFYFFNTTSS